MDYKKREKEFKTLVTILKDNGILKQITLKKVKTQVGHDLGGFYCDFYLKNYGKIGFVNDDGWGGEVSPSYESNEKQKVFEDFLQKNNIAKLMFENGWLFMKKLEEIDLNTQANSIIEIKLGQIQSEKFDKKREKTTKSGIVFGNNNYYKSISFKISLLEIIQKKGGVKFLQNHYDKIKSDLKENEKILNENLEGLGIKL